MNDYGHGDYSHKSRSRVVSWRVVRLDSTLLYSVPPCRIQSVVVHETRS